MRLTTSALYREAYGRYAVGHFNVTNMEQILAVFEGAMQARAPFIIALSRAAWAYAGLSMLHNMIEAAHAEHPDAIFAVHHDHGTEETCYQAIDSGCFTSVMIDASHHPFEENVTITRRVVEQARAADISVEAELGILAGVEDDISVRQDQALLTHPTQAAEFVSRTDVDSLAVAVGTSHGAYKFASEGGIRLDRLIEIQEKLPGFPLILHGASAVYPNEIERINAAGGALIPGAKGVDERQLHEAIRFGITKVNIGTDGRLLWTRVHREFFRDNPDRFDFAEPGKVYVQEFARLVAHKCHVLRCAGKLEKVRAAVTPGSP